MSFGNSSDNKKLKKLQADFEKLQEVSKKYLQAIFEKKPQNRTEYGELLDMSTRYLELTTIMRQIEKTTLEIDNYMGDKKRNILKEHGFIK